MGIKTTFQTTADKMFVIFADFVKSVSYQQFTDGTYNPTTGSSGSYAAATTIDVVFTSYRVEQIDGTVIQVNDKLALAKNLTFTPKATDKFTQDSVIWNVVSADDGGTDGILWNIQVRR